MAEILNQIGIWVLLSFFACFAIGIAAHCKSWERLSYVFLALALVIPDVYLILGIIYKLVPDVMIVAVLGFSVGVLQLLGMLIKSHLKIVSRKERRRNVTRDLV